MAPTKPKAKTTVRAKPRATVTRAVAESFCTRFAAMYAAMRADTRIEVVSPSRLAHGSSSARMLRFALEEVEAATGVKADVFAAYAGDLYHTQIYWLGPRDASGLHPFGGEIRLQGIASLTRPFESLPGWSLFDDHPGAGDGIMTMIRAHEARWQLGVHEHGSVSPMDIDIAGYMAALLDLRGAFGWQWLFVAGSGRKTAATTLLDRVHGFFGTDVSRYEGRQTRDLVESVARPSRPRRAARAHHDRSDPRAIRHHHQAIGPSDGAVKSSIVASDPNT
ncbi:MAG: hypothetical protein WCJ30_08990 [Deltaproteobacteria bacterium]